MFAVSKFYQIKSYVKHYFTATKKGHGVHSPFAYKLCEEVFYNNAHFFAYEELNELREKLKTNSTKFIVNDFGAGSKILQTNERSINKIAKHGISKKFQAEILFKLINFLNLNTRIELGSSIGLTTLYLAMANKKGSVYSLEGSEALINFSEQQAQQFKITNCEFILGNFNDTLKPLLQKLNSFDFCYVDGNHIYSATINYFELLLKHKHQNSVIIFDDIYWSTDMTKAWIEIKKHRSVTLSIDAFYFGIIFFKPDIKEKIELKICL